MSRLNSFRSWLARVVRKPTRSKPYQNSAKVPVESSRIPEDAELLTCPNCWHNLAHFVGGHMECLSCGPVVLDNTRVLR